MVLVPQSHYPMILSAGHDAPQDCRLTHSRLRLCEDFVKFSLKFN